MWPHPQASRFIESLLLGLPVPAIFLSRESDTQKLMVIDGQQRLKSLLFFYEGLLHGKEFKLHGVTKEFEGMTYRTLEEEDRRRLDDSILHAIVIKQEDPGNDDSSVYMVFERLNTTSTALSPQEIRACVYHGTFNDYLAKANGNPDWREIFGKPSVRQKDCECWWSTPVAQPTRNCGPSLPGTFASWCRAWSRSDAGSARPRMPCCSTV